LALDCFASLAMTKKEYLMSTTTRTPVAEREITFVRTFDAPRELVFSMWTEAKHLAQWWGPHHFDNPVCKADARVGGAILIHMRGPDRSVHVMDGVYLEITPYTRIAFTTSVDDNGVRLLEGTNVVTFEQDGGKTKMTLQAKVSGFTEIAKMMVGGFNAGWTQSLEKLEALLGSQRSS
jgi:uncharacterized protein YndB with AHSA1/START domain